MPLAAAITGAAAIAGAGISAWGQGKANKKSIELARENRAYDNKMWHEANTYNSPTMQMQRLREAGLNPNLVYGSGQAQTASQPAPKSNLPRVDNTLASVGQMNMTPAISMYMDWQVKKAQIDNVEAQTEYTRRRADTELINVVNQQIKRDASRFDLSQKQRLADTQFNVADATLRKIQNDIDLKNKGYNLQKLLNDANLKLKSQQTTESSARTNLHNKEYDVKNMEYEYQKSLRKLGLSPDAPWYVKPIANWLGNGDNIKSTRPALKEGQTLQSYYRKRQWNPWNY